MSSNHNASRSRLLALALTTVLASGALAGCTADVAPEARVSAGKATEALGKGRHSAAIRHAEAAVMAEPRRTEHRVMLGATYLQAGRFASAETSFAEAMELGDTSSRVVVSRALAQIATGRADAAYALLDRHVDAIDPVDLGLAYALAGDARQGANILTRELRHNQNTPKVRQNLAYALALKGDWRSARLLVSEDVPADKVGERLGLWASTAGADGQALRVANLLGVTVAADDVRPAQLALGNFPSTPMLAAEAAASQPVDAAPAIAVAMPIGSGSDQPSFPAVAQLAPEPNAVAVPQPAPPAPRAVAGVSVPTPVPAPAPAKPTAKPAAPVRVAAAQSPPAPAPRLASGNHNVQLGSYLSEADARRGWSGFQARFVMLKDAPLVLTKAQVNGRIYYRVAAGNLAEASARTLCSTVKARGQSCFAYSGARPLPGTIGNTVRVARR